MRRVYITCDICGDMININGTYTLIHIETVNKRTSDLVLRTQEEIYNRQHKHLCSKCSSKLYHLFEGDA